MNITFNARHRNYFMFSFIVLLCFLIYWPSLIALPKADHSFILYERQFYDNDVDFFINALSFTRTRHIAPGDAYLFRPGITGLLALLDIYFRENLYMLGALSILWHAIAVFSEYLIFQRIKIGAVTTYSLMVIILVEYPGMDMIIWRHISPYIFALVFLMIGLMALLRAENSKLRLRTSIFVSCMFFISTLFHELLVIALPLAFILTVFTPLRKRLGLRLLSIILLMPSMSYMALNMADYFLHQSPSVLGSADSIQAQLKLTDALTLPGIFLYQFIFPFFVQIESLRARTTWNFDNIFGAEFLFPSLGFIFLTLVGLIFTRLIVVLNRNGESNTSLNMHGLLIVIILSSLVSLLGGLLVGRVGLRGMSYMQISTYYFYFFNFLLVLVIGLMLPIYKQWIEERFEKIHIAFPSYIKPWLRIEYITVYPKYFGVIIIAFFILAKLMVMNQAILGANLKEDRLMAKVSLWASNISKKREYCYAGSEVGIVPDVLLYRESCQVKEGMPVVLRQGKGISLDLAAKNSSTVISTYYMNIIDISTPPQALSEVQQRLIGEWNGDNGKIGYIFFGADNVIIVANEDGFRDQLEIDGKSITAMHWKVQPHLSDDGKVLNWGNGTVWTR